MDRNPSWGLTVAQLVGAFPPFGEPRVSLPHSRGPATCPYLEPDASSPRPPHPISLRSILILSSHLGLPGGTSVQIFRPKFCKHFLSLPCVPHAPPAWSGEEYKVWSPSLCHVETDRQTDRQRLQVTCVSVVFLRFVFGKLSDLNVVCLSAGHRILGSVILFTTVLWPHILDVCTSSEFQLKDEN